MIGLLTNRYVLGALAVIALLGMAVAYVKAREAAAVEEARLERQVADLKALAAESERQRKAAENALANAAARAERRARENHLLRVEIDGFKDDLAAGRIAACPSTPAYRERMCAVLRGPGCPGYAPGDERGPESPDPGAAAGG